MFIFIFFSFYSFKFDLQIMSDKICELLWKTDFSLSHKKTETIVIDFINVLLFWSAYIDLFTDA